jgi:hypothetical protein
MKGWELEKGVKLGGSIEALQALTGRVQCCMVSQLPINWRDISAISYALSVCGSRFQGRNTDRKRVEDSQAKGDGG